MISLFPRQTIEYHSNQSLCPNQYAEEAEIERFNGDLQDLLELTPKKDVILIIGAWNAKVISQEILGVTGKLGISGGIFHAKMGSKKDRNGMDLTEAEDIKRWQEYTE